MSASMIVKALRFEYRVRGVFKRLFGNGSKIYVRDRVGFYESMWREAACELSAEFYELTTSIWEIRRGQSVTRVDNYKVQLDDPVILAIAGKKSLCHQLLKEHAVPVPDFLQFDADTLDWAYAFAEQYDGYFVVKPAVDTAAGLGVSTHLKTPKEIRRAAVLASLYSNQLLIERLVPGELYRLVFLYGKLIAASRRKGIRIRGNGKSSIRELTREKTGDRHSLFNDRDYRATLDAQNLSDEKILAKMEDILVKAYDRSLCVDQEAVPTYNEDAVESICEALIQRAGQAVKIIGSDFAGVDLITLDPAVPLEQSGGKIIEVNTTPGLHHHYNLLNDNRDVKPATIVLKHLLEQCPSRLEV